MNEDSMDFDRELADLFKETAEKRLLHQKVRFCAAITNLIQVLKSQADAGMDIPPFFRPLMEVGKDYIESYQRQIALGYEFAFNYSQTADQKKVLEALNLTECLLEAFDIKAIHKLRQTAEQFLKNKDRSVRERAQEILNKFTI